MKTFQVTIALILLGLSSTQAAVLFTDDFTIPGDLQGVNWEGYYSSSGTDFSSQTGVIYNGTGEPSGGTGYVYLASPIGLDSNLIYTTQASVSSIDIANITSVDFYTRNTAGGGDWHVAVKVSGQWYQSVASYTSGTWTAQSHAFSTTNTDWYQVAFTAGSNLDITGTTNPLSSLSGNLEAFGFINTTGTATARIDAITINGTAVPEPSTWAMLILGVVALSSVTLIRHKTLA